MILELTEICTCENKEAYMDAHIEAVSFDSRLGSFPFREKKPFKLHVVNRENKHVLITGETDVIVAIPCDRCLKEVPVRIHLDFDKKFSLTETAEVSEETEETDYLKGFHLDVDRLVYDEILVNWPMKVLCKDDCKGICRKCGANLNLQDCNCGEDELDPRMAAIQDVFNKFKEV